MRRNAKGFTLLYLLALIAAAGTFCILGYQNLATLSQFRHQARRHLQEYALIGNAQRLLDRTYPARLAANVTAALDGATWATYAQLARSGSTGQPLNTSVTSSSIIAYPTGTPFALLTAYEGRAIAHRVTDIPFVQLNGRARSLDYNWTSRLNTYSPFDFQLILNQPVSAHAVLQLNPGSSATSLAWVRDWPSGLSLSGNLPPNNLPPYQGVISPAPLPAFTHAHAWSDPRYAAAVPNLLGALASGTSTYFFDGAVLTPSPPAGLRVEMVGGTNRVIVDLGELSTPARLSIQYATGLAEHGLVVIGPDGPSALESGGNPVAFTAQALDQPVILVTNARVFLWGSLNPATSAPLIVGSDYAGSGWVFEFNADPVFESPAGSSAVWGGYLVGIDLSIGTQTVATPTLAVSGLWADSTLRIENAAYSALTCILATHVRKDELASLIPGLTAYAGTELLFAP